MKQILIVFDNTDDLHKIVLLISLGRFKLKTAFSSDEMAEVLKEGFDPDLVISGGKVAGVEAADIARQLHGTIKKDTPILALTAAGNKPEPGLFYSILQTPCKLSALEAAMKALGFGVF